MKKFGFYFLVLFYWSIQANAETLRFVAFNVESGGAHPSKISEQIRTLGSVDVWGFSEVKNFSWAMQFKAAAMDSTGLEYRFEFGTTGGGDRLVLLYNQDKLELLEKEELHEINPEGRVRAPLVGKFRVKATGDEFFAMVNHLYRKRSDLRSQQARQIRQWADTKDIPVIALGDFNFDWESDDDHGQGFDAITNNDVFKWIKPENAFVNGTVLPTQCHNDFRSILDFIFASGSAKEWESTSTILFPEPDYCPDDNTESDHRPVEVVFNLKQTDADQVDDDEQMASLRSIIKSLEDALALAKMRLAQLEAE